jgi:transcriptional regulator with XRE-family HTH domain
MAEKLGLDRSYLADLKRGKRNVALMNLEVIALGFELSLSQLLSRV